MTRRWMAVVAAGVAVVLVVPLLWWRVLGPTRVEGLQLGEPPADIVARDDLANVPDVDAAADAAERQKPRTIELPPLTISASTRITVITSLGSAGMTPAEARRLRVADLGDRGADRLTDSILLLISDAPTREAALLSLPRDLWLTHRGHRINETLARRGTQAFIDDVSRVSGLPVHHLVQLNFTAFATLVDGIGGIAVEVSRPMADLHAALYVPEAGCWHFQGADALAYARSRMTLTTRDGGETWRPDAGASDFARMRRQQALAAAAWDQIRGPGFVKRIPDLVRLADGLTIDASLGLDDVRELARAFGDVAAGRIEGHVLPVVGRRVGRARVLAIDYSRALPLYARLRSWPPSTSTSPPAPAARDEEPEDAGPTPAATPSPGDGSDDAPTAGPRRVDANGCSRSSARELPDPGPALAAIARGDPTPTHPNADEAADGEDPDDAASPAPDEQDGEDPDDGPSDGPGQDPSDAPGPPALPDELPSPPADDSDQHADGPSDPPPSS